MWLSFHKSYLEYGYESIEEGIGKQARGMALKYLTPCYVCGCFLN